MTLTQRRIYREPTVPVAFRTSEASRRLLDHVALTGSGIVEGPCLPAHYLRAVWEQHLRDLGYDLEPGETAVSDPDWGTRAGLDRDETISNNQGTSS